MGVIRSDRAPACHPPAFALLLFVVPLLGLAGPPAPPAPRSDALVRTVGGVQVDWSAGMIRAEAGSAADYRLPTPEIARAGAERRAHAAALAGLRGALRALPLGPGRKLSAAEIDAALTRARTAGVEYQSNGGAVVTLSLRFAEVSGVARAEPDAKPPARALAVAAMPLELAPRVAAGESEAVLGWVVYRVGPPPSDAEVVTVQRDKEGRLILPPGERQSIEKLAGTSAVIYVQKIVK
jgi:hypothetical protein